MLLVFRSRNRRISVVDSRIPAPNGIRGRAYIGATYARSNKNEAAPRSARHRRAVRAPAAHCVGCETQIAPGGPERQDSQNQRWGNRRWRTRAPQRPYPPKRSLPCAQDRPWLIPVLLEVAHALRRRGDLADRGYHHRLLLPGTRIGVSGVAMLPKYALSGRGTRCEHSDSQVCRRLSFGTECASSSAAVAWRSLHRACRMSSGPRFAGAGGPCGGAVASPNRRHAMPKYGRCAVLQWC